MRWAACGSHWGVAMHQGKVVHEGRGGARGRGGAPGRGVVHRGGAWSKGACVPQSLPSHDADVVCHVKGARAELGFLLDEAEENGGRVGPHPANASDTVDPVVDYRVRQERQKEGHPDGNGEDYCVHWYARGARHLPPKKGQRESVVAGQGEALRGMGWEEHSRRSQNQEKALQSIRRESDIAGPQEDSQGMGLQGIGREKHCRASKGRSRAGRAGINKRFTGMGVSQEAHDSGCSFETTHHFG